MRNPSFHRVLSRFALAAMLLLVALPTLGRLAGPAHPPTHALSMPHEGMPHGHLAHGHAIPAPHDAGDPLPPGHAHAQDCAYCALLAGAMPTALLAPIVPAAPEIRLALMRIALPVPTGGHGSGLGARGPPRLIGST